MENEDKILCNNKSKEIQQLVDMKEFYFEKLKILFQEFERYTINDEQLDKLLKQVKTKFSFEQFLLDNEALKEFILLMGKIIAMSDYHGYNKNQWNDYDDKRVIAKASIRQNNWVKNLLVYKKTNNLNNLSSGVKHFIEFIQQPSINLTQLSKKHRGLISKFLLNKTYDDETFFNDLKKYFENTSFNEYIRNLKNQQNLGVLLSFFLNCEEIKQIWNGEKKMIDENINYWLVGANWDSVDKTSEFLNENIWINGYESKYLDEVNAIKKGDMLAIKSSYTKSKNLPFENSGKTVSVMKIKAVGKVIDNMGDGKQIKVEWDKSFIPKEIYHFSYRNTIAKLDKKTKSNLIELVFYGKNQNYFFNHQVSSINQILYGPPGTGKTYHTINKAIEIIENRVVNSDENREELKKKFDEYKQSGQIEFITFHQSYGYEEFVEGLKAKTDGSGNISYSVENGIFKSLAKKAQNKECFYEGLVLNNYKIEKITQECLHIKKPNENILILPKHYIFLLVNLVKRDELTTDDIKNKKAIEYMPSNTEPYMINGYPNIIAKLVEFCVTNIREEHNNKNYILIIDEINRGNISKIFGELITLIEPSKRIGAEEEIKLKLPYSGDEFGVPKNLYIIGTMNTADRSIAQIDTALRRRFEFVEMLPKPSLLENVVIEDIEVSKVLEAINERIEYIYDKDHTIGHSYFLPLQKEKTKEKLDEIFRVNIIPLLTEYFYSDWEDIAFVLNNDFIQEKETPKYLQNTSRQLNKVYEINSNFTKEQYRAIYQANE